MLRRTVISDYALHASIGRRLADLSIGIVNAIIVVQTAALEGPDVDSVSQTAAVAGAKIVATDGAVFASGIKARGVVRDVVAAAIA